MRKGPTIFWVAFGWMLAAPIVSVLFALPHLNEALELSRTLAEEGPGDYPIPEMSSLLWLLNDLHSSVYILFTFYAFREILHRFHDYTDADKAILCNAIWFAVMGWIPELYGPGDEIKFNSLFTANLLLSLVVCFLFGGLVLWLAIRLKPLGNRALFGLNESFVLMHRLQGIALLCVIGFCVAIIAMPIIWVQYLLIFYRAARAGGEPEWEEVALDADGNLYE